MALYHNTLKILLLILVCPNFALNVVHLRTAYSPPPRPPLPFPPKKSAVGIIEPEITHYKMSPSSLKEYFNFHTE